MNTPVSQWLPVLDRAELSPGDDIHDGYVNGWVVSLQPVGRWAEDGDLRIVAKWGISKFRSEPRIDELVRKVPSFLTNDGRCSGGTDHAPTRGMPYWLPDGQRHRITSCSGCGMKVAPGKSETPREVAVTEHDLAICHACLFRRLNILSLPGGRVDFAPFDYTHRVCHCSPCLALIDTTTPEAHS